MKSKVIGFPLRWEDRRQFHRIYGVSISKSTLFPHVFRAGPQLYSNEHEEFRGGKVPTESTKSEILLQQELWVYEWNYGGNGCFLNMFIGLEDDFQTIFVGSVK